MKMNLNAVQYAQVAIDEGFYIHHCTKDYLLLAKWLHNSVN